MRVRRHDRGRFFPESPDEPVTCKYTDSRPDSTSHTQSCQADRAEHDVEPVACSHRAGRIAVPYQNSGSQSAAETRGPRDLAGHRRRRRDGADLGRGRHPPRHPHRPRLTGAGGGDRAGRDLAGHRQQQRRCGSGPSAGRPAQASQRYGSTVMSRAAPGSRKHRPVHRRLSRCLQILAPAAAHVIPSHAGQPWQRPLSAWATVWLPEPQAFPTIASRRNRRNPCRALRPVPRAIRARLKVTPQSTHPQHAF